MTDPQPIIDAARASVEPWQTEDGVTHFRVPEGWMVETHDPEKREPSPYRPRGTTHLYDLDSFARRLDVLGGAGTVVYADPDERSLTAVVNDDGESAGWRDHRLAYVLRPTPSWTYWTANEGLHEQQKFAEVIEDGLDDIANPDPSTMIEIARSFSASIGTRFRQAANLRDGARQLVYEETVEAKGGGSGEVTIPDSFDLLVAPYEGTEARKITARLRFRIRDGQLAIGYALPLASRLADDSFREIVTEATGRVGPSIVLGRAPSPTA